MGNQRHQKNAARDKWIAPSAPVLAQHFNRWTGDVGGWVMSTPKTARLPVPANPGRGRNRKFNPDREWHSKGGAYKA